MQCALGIHWSAPIWSVPHFVFLTTRLCIFSPQSVSKTPTVIDYKLCSTKRDKILLCNAMQYLECFIKCKKRPGIVYWRRSSIPCVWIALCLTIFCFKYQLRCISRTLYYICTVLLYSHKGPSLCFLCIVFPCIVFWVSAKVSPSRVSPMHITPVHALAVKLVLHHHGHHGHHVYHGHYGHHGHHGHHGHRDHHLAPGKPATDDREKYNNQCD